MVFSLVEIEGGALTVHIYKQWAGLYKEEGPIMQCQQGVWLPGHPAAGIPRDYDRH